MSKRQKPINSAVRKKSSEQTIHLKKRNNLYPRRIAENYKFYRPRTERIKE